MNEPIDAASTERTARDPSTIEEGLDRGSRRFDLRERLNNGEPMAAGELVELLCSDQVDRWRAGERIPAEAYLALHPTLQGGGETAFELVYSEFLIRESFGESPKLDEFRWRFPHFAERLQRQLSLHSALSEGAGRTEVELDGKAGTGRTLGLAVPLVPGYDIVDVLGQGGMSVVYLARQVALNRLVALKVIRATVYADPEVAARFRDEAEVAARFQHPNIVQVHEVGESEGYGYIVLEYASGGSLQQKLAGNPQPPREAARLIEPLALALHYAHQRGIVHRDLKPANVVLTEEGVPKVTDFGLAKLMEREAGLTRTGDIMGTPSYMAPEQARGLPSEVTASADIYALGAILYEMLTGRPPFKGATPLSTLSQAAEQDALPPGRLQRHLPRELETICLKCLEKDPHARYATAQDLADDLRRFLEDRPIVARRISRAEWLWRWCRREPAKASLAVGLAVAVVAGFLGVTVQKQRAEERALAEARERARAEAAEDSALHNLYFSRLAQARLEWRQNNALVARQLLDGCDPNRRGWEWRYLENLSHPQLRDIKVPEGMVHVNAVAFSPDGRRFAFSAYNPYGATKEELRNPVEIWDTDPPRRIAQFEAPRPSACLSFSPDGRRLAASGPEGARLCDATTGTEVHSWPPIGAVSYSPDGKALVSCRDRRVTFRDPETGRVVREFESASGRVTYRPDGRAIAVSGADDVELRDAASGQVFQRLPHGPGDPQQRQTRYYGEQGPELAFSPDGRSLAVATDPPRVWDASTGALRHQLSGHDGTVQGIAFSPDGRWIATAGVDSTIRIWDARTGSEQSVLRGHSSWAACVAFHPDGWCLLSGSRQGAEVALWDLTRQTERTSLRGNLPTAIHFDQDSHRLRMAGSDGRLYGRDVEGAVTEVGPLVDMTQRYMTPAVLAEFSDDGRRLVTVPSDRKLVKVFDAADGRPLATLEGLTDNGTYVAASRDGGRVAVAAATLTKTQRTREVMAWDATSGRVLSTFHPTAAPTPYVHGRVALAGDGSLIAFDDYEDAVYDVEARAPLGQPRVFVKVHEVDGGRERLKLFIPDSDVIYCLAFSRDGRHLAGGEKTGKVRIWDVRTGQVLHETQWDGECFRLSFSPDGRRLAGVNRSRVQVRDVEDGREILILHGAESRSLDGGFNPVVAWSLDGTRLAASNWDRSTAIWNGPIRTIPPEQGWTSAQARIFGWHLDEADAAIAAGQASAAGFHLDRLQPAEPPDITSRLRRADIAVRLHRWDAAGEDYARWFATAPAEDRDAHLSYARLLLVRGNLEGYRGVFRHLLDTCEKQSDHRLAWQLARIVGLAPCPIPDAERVVKLQPATAREPGVHPRILYALAIAQYRANQWEPARVTLTEFMNRDTHDAWRAYPLMAMIEHRLGHHREAEDQLSKAKAKRDEHGAHAASSSDLLDPEWFEYGRLYQEAEQTLGK